MKPRDARGFTLLEVMVALAIVSIGLIAAFNGVIQMAFSTATLRERALADWIAMNEITTIRVSGEFPEVGRFDGNTEFAGREWRWEAHISDTGVSDLRRIDMHVAHDDAPEDAITIMTGFVSRGSGTPPPRIDWLGAGGPGPGPDGGQDGDPDAEQPPEGAEPTPEAPRQPRQPRRSDPPPDDEE
jgi:general secretion pathway protein I